MGTGGSFPGGKAGGGGGTCPPATQKCCGHENEDLYGHSPIRLHGVELNSLSTGTNLPFLPIKGEGFKFFLKFWFVRLFGHSWPIVPASGDSEDIVEKQMECRLAGEIEVLGGENLPQRNFCSSQNST
jgi:hypothetical protein